MTEQMPVEKRTCDSTVAISKRVLVTNRELQADGLDQRVKVVSVLQVVMRRVNPVNRSFRPTVGGGT